MQPPDRETLMALAERALVAHSAGKSMTVTPAEHALLMRVDAIEWDDQLREAWQRTGMPIGRTPGPYDDILMIGAIGNFAALPIVVEWGCCRWDHVRPCGPVPGNPMVDDGGEPICACGCSGYDERCGGGEWWLPEFDSMEAVLAGRRW